MTNPWTSAEKVRILTMKSEGRSFREISEQLGRSLGSITGLYYRMKGVRHPSQLARDADLRQRREANRLSRKRVKNLAAIQAAIDLKNGAKFSDAVGLARASGASFEAIGVCLGISKQALHKKWRATAGQTSPAPSRPDRANGLTYKPSRNPETEKVVPVVGGERAAVRRAKKLRIIVPDTAANDTSCAT